MLQNGAREKIYLQNALTARIAAGTYKHKYNLPQLLYNIL